MRLSLSITIVLILELSLILFVFGHSKEGADLSSSSSSSSSLASASRIRSQIININDNDNNDDDDDAKNQNSIQQMKISNSRLRGSVSSNQNNNNNIDIEAVEIEKHINYELLYEYYNNNNNNKKEQDDDDDTTTTIKSRIRNVIRKFKNEYHVKDDAILSFQSINKTTTTEVSSSSSMMTVTINGKQFPLISSSVSVLKPIQNDIFAPNATYYFNGKDISHILQNRTHNQYQQRQGPLSFIGRHRGEEDDDNDDYDIMITKKNRRNDDESDDDDTIQSISITAVDGSYQYYLVSIVPGILVTITPQMRDLERMKTIFGINNEQEEQQHHNLDLDLDQQHKNTATTTTTTTTSTNNSSSSVVDSNDDVRSRLRNRRSLQGSLEPCTSYQVIEVAIAYDSSFCEQEGGTMKDAEESIQIIVEQASMIYRSQGVCGKIVLTHLEGYCSQGNDPFIDAVNTRIIGCQGQRGIMDEFGDWVRENRIYIQRHTFHLFYAGPNGLNTRYGCANQDTLCNNNAVGVDNFSFGNDINLRGALFAHEIGHNIGLQHVQNTIMYTFYVMGGIGAGPHIWSPHSLSQINQLMPDKYCIQNEIAPNKPITPNNNIVGQYYPLGSGSGAGTFNQLCLNAIGMNHLGNPIVRTWYCNGLMNQKWEWDENNYGTLRSQMFPTLCLGIGYRPDPNARGGRIATAKLVECNPISDPTQQWTWTSTGQITSFTEINTCVHWVRDGRAAQISTCNPITQYNTWKWD